MFFLFRVLASLEGKGVHLHLLYHCKQSVGPGRRKVFGESDSVYEIELRVKDFRRGMPVEHFYEQCYDAFYYYGIGIGGVKHLSVTHFGVEPHSALAPFYEVSRSLEFLINRGKAVSKVDNHGVSVHPVVHAFEILYNLVLQLVYGHNAAKISKKTEYPAVFLFGFLFRQYNIQHCLPYGFQWGCVYGRHIVAQGVPSRRKGAGYGVVALYNVDTGYSGAVDKQVVIYQGTAYFIGKKVAVSGVGSCAPHFVNHIFCSLV